MTALWKLFRRTDYDDAVSKGLIKTTKHPDLDLWIHNYTQSAQYTKGAWDNPAVRMCRGIITDAEDEILAQPFPKFFNHNQPEAGELYPMAAVKVLDKMDGSLGILFPTGGVVINAGFRVPEYNVATRGSFTSEQAIHATRVWKERYEPQFTPNPVITYLVEIIYPENRIVVDYGDMDELVLLGACRTGRKEFSYFAGMSCSGADWWPGPVAKTFPFRNLKQALEAPPRENAEGLVVIFTNKMVKIKQEDYVELHRLVTGLRPRSIWEFLAVNACKHLIEKPKHWGSRIGLDPERAKTILEIGDDWRTQYLEKVPDEMMGWFDEKVRSITRSVEELEAELTSVAERLRHLPRKEYFLRIQEHQHRGILGLMYDDRDITTALWKAVYPNAEGRPWKEQSEDNA